METDSRSIECPIHAVCHVRGKMTAELKNRIRNAFRDVSEVEQVDTGCVKMLRIVGPENIHVIN